SLIVFSVMATLEFAEVTPLDGNLYPRQASDGSYNFLHKASIKIHSSGQKVTATKSWDGGIRNIYCFGDALYFQTITKKVITCNNLFLLCQIYRATFHPPNEI
ncbi:hypothetical protein PFISCL1PPCAC_16992, partial [Pristionchus fissidentatus]